MVGSGRISNSSKLLCMSSLPVSMKRIPSRTTKKNFGNTVFPIITQSVTMETSSRISNSSKRSCMLSLPASMKWIRSRTAEKKWRHRFSHYKPMGIVSDVQRQLTLQSVVQSRRNSNSSELACMSSLPASMKRNR